MSCCDVPGVHSAVRHSALEEKGPGAAAFEKRCSAQVVVAGSACCRGAAALKDRVFDEVLLLDGPTASQWTALLPVLSIGLPFASLYEASHRELAESFLRASETLGYEAREVHHLYQLRHGGASHDAAGRQRTTEEIRKRGRWESHKSLRRYESGGTSRKC